MYVHACVYVYMLLLCLRVFYICVRARIARVITENETLRDAREREMRTKYHFDTVTFLLAVSHSSSSFFLYWFVMLLLLILL